MPDDLEFRGDDRFDVVRRIAAGGGGVVYEAFDRTRRTRVALKVIAAPEPQAVLRLKNEFRALQDVSHPNLVRPDELVQTGARWFVTMELVDGVDFVRHVRVEDRGRSVLPTRELVPPAGEPPPEPPHVDEPRLRAALRQLAAAVVALHRHGKVHRDLKPANILVTREGRVVVLDFGLVTDEHHPTHVTAEGHIVGTPAYMAPEQATPGPVTAAADWFSVGVVLYEALTGQLPHDGSTFDLLHAKQRLVPLRPDLLVAGLPADLVALCVRLLAIDPAERPSGAEVQRVLGDDVAAPATIARADRFVGRQDELARLGAAFDDARRHGAVTVRIEGESGIGKTALIQQLREVLVRERGALVLAARCYERENVRFAGVDGLLDALVGHLLACPARTAELVPVHAALLVQVFPALRRLDAFADLPIAPPRALGPNELRTRVLAALHELFVRVAERHPLALIIDDVHWLGGDGLAALRAIVAGPGSPRLVLVATTRAGALPPVVITGDERRVRLGPLPVDASLALAAALAGDGPCDLAAIAHEAAGHPLHLGELVRHAAAGGDAAAGPPSLDDAIAARVAACSPVARRVLALVAAFGAPLARELAGDAAGLTRPALDDAIAALRGARLLVASGAGGTHLEPDHHRVTLAVLARTEPAARIGLHRALALALEQRQPRDLDGLAFHWRCAGEAGHAARLAIEAADEAVGLVAFDRAARNYRLALAHLPGGEDRLEVRRKLGEALSYAMRGPEAAEVYLEAAHDAPAAFALELRRRAVEQLLITGHVRRANALLEQLLADIGMRLPRTNAWAVVSLLARRATLRVLGARVRPRDASQLPARELAEIDICFDAALGLGMSDPVRAAAFQARHLRRCLRAGEPNRIARALSLEAVFRATAGSAAQPDVERLQRISEQVSRGLGRGHGYTVGWATVARGVFEFLAGRWKSARDTLRIAADLMREHPAHVPTAGSVHGFIIDTAEIYHLGALVFLGELPELRARAPALLAGAVERNDLYLATHLRSGVHVLAHLARGEVAEARAATDAAIAPWVSDRLHVPHVMHAQACASIALYLGDGAAAHAQLVEAWPRFAKAFLLHVQYLRISLVELRGRAALGAAAAATAPRDRARYVRDARRCARRLLGEHGAWARPLGEILLAGASALRGDADAARHLRAAADGFLAADMALHAAAARHRLGQVLGGDAGDLIAREAIAWLGGAQIVDAARFSELLVPGFAASLVMVRSRSFSERSAPDRMLSSTALRW